jgi:hypothetical protein
MVNVIVSSLLVVLSASPHEAQAAQASSPVIALAPAGETQELRLKDGTRAIGRVETIEGGGFTFRTTSGVMMEVDEAQVSALGSVARQEAARLKVPETMHLSGPRFGFTFMSDGIVRKLRDDDGIDIEVGSMVTQFGWQKEKRFYSGENGLTAVTEWIFLVGGLEQGVVLPSFSWLVGLRTAKGIEFAVGPNLTAAGVAIAAAAGTTFRAGHLNVPVNLAVVPSKSGVRVSLLAGFNMRRGDK